MPNEWKEWLRFVGNFMRGEVKSREKSPAQVVDQRPHITVKIFGKPVTGLLDSGASRSFLSQEGLEKMSLSKGEAMRPSSTTVATASGSRMPVEGIMVLPVELEGRMKLIEFLIVKKLSSPLILGVDFWKKMSLLPDISQGMWKFSQEEDTTFHSLAALRCGESLTPEEQVQLEQLIERWRAKQPAQLGATSKVQHIIDTGDSRPIKQRYYPISPHNQKIMDRELEDMLAQGIVERSNSAWSSPVVLVKKPDGSVRFCVDYRKLNQVTKRDAYPLPYVTNILDRLRDARVLSTIDIKSAYWQVAVAAESREKTAFTVPNRGLFQFKRMPFGLHNAPATWQRLIDEVLGADLEPYVFVYLDDIIVVSSDFRTHIQTLNSVLERLSKANLTLNWEKSQFCRPELRYLGYVVNQKGLLVDPQKIEAIMKFPTPKTVKQVRQFIGLASWYRRFVPHFSTLIAPLSALTKKKQRWVWGKEQDEAVTSVKEKLIAAPVLSCPDFTKPFFLQTDASKTGLGAILYQAFEEGEKPVAYASRSLNSAERKYSVTEQECLAVLWAVQKFRPYLEGTRFTVVTDHQALKWLHNLRDPQGRLARWALQLQEYDFEILHRPGRQNAAADALSRAHEEELAAIELSYDQLDPWYEKMLGNVERDPGNYPSWRREGRKLWKEVRAFRGMENPEGQWKMVVPKSQRVPLLKELHDSPLSGHFGTYKTLRRIRERYYWPGMASEVAKYVRRCAVCLAVKPSQLQPAGLMGGHREVSKPWQLVASDIMGPLPMSKARNRFIITFTDCFTKYVVMKPVRTATAGAVTRVLEEDVILMFGAPKVILCDNGPQYKSKEFRKKAEEYQVKIWYTPYYHPQANPAERPNRVIKTMLAAYVKDNQRDWDKQLPKVAFAMKTAVHEVTGYTPAFLNFGRELARSRSQHPDVEETEGVPEMADRNEYAGLMRDRDELHRDVASRLAQAYEKSKNTYNLRRRPQIFSPGDTVWKRNFQQSDAASYFAQKLAPKFIKCRVKEKIGRDTYLLEDFNGSSLGTWHTKDLKPNPT